MTNATRWVSQRMPSMMLLATIGCTAPTVPGLPQDAEPVMARPVPGVDRSNSGVATRQRLVIQDPAAWTTTWAQIVGTASPRPPVPAIDFDSDVVIVAAMGTRGSSGYSIDVDDVRTLYGDAWISVHERSHGSPCIVLPVELSPIAVVTVPRFEGGATFLEHASVVDCPP